jgi:Beta-galactosidase
MARADKLVLPPALERNQSAPVAYRFAEPMTGHGFLDIEWSDVAGRTVDRRRIPLNLAGASEAVFTLDINRAVAIKNQIVARLSIDGLDQGGRPIHRENEETTSFIAMPAPGAWSDYQIIAWQAQTPAGYATLKKLGITAGMLETNHRDEASLYSAGYLGQLVDAGLRCYLENIATDFYSPYHKWYDDGPVNCRFLEAKQRYWENPLDLTAFIRNPSLSDPEWLKKIQDRLTRMVQALHPYRPLYYSLGDETGIGDLAAFWDFDLSDHSLAAMRDWLKHDYASLAALNLQWGTAFGRWEEVLPMTTDQAVQRADDNFSAWADFKEWMDVAFARAVKSGTDAIHGADPGAVSAIEGAQIPGWGGYDCSRLAGSVDAMELYDYGENVAIAHSFNPELIMLTTSFKGGPFEAHRVWRELLRGTRGLVLWDDQNAFVGRDGSLGERGREAASYFGEIRGGLGALLINSRRHTDPIGILYSPASMRVQWLLDRRAAGEDWSRRNASAEYQDNAIRTATGNFAHALRHMGLQHRFVSSEEVEQGELQRGRYRVLILPHAIAIAPNEAERIRDFVEQGGVVVADSEPALFDGHGRRAAKPLLSQVFDGPPTRSATSLAYGKGKAIYLAISDGRRRESTRLSEILAAAGVTPPFPLVGTVGQRVDDVETSIFSNGGMTILALQRDYVPSPNPGSGEAIVLAFPHPLDVYDLRAQRALGNLDHVDLDVGPVEPVLLSLSEKPIAPPAIAGPTSTHCGDSAEFLIHSNSPAARGIVHLDVIEPEGSMVAHYSGNLLVAGGATAKLLPLAFNDKTGIWKLRARDLPSGETATTELLVAP